MLCYRRRGTDPTGQDILQGGAAAAAAAAGAAAAEDLTADSPSPAGFGGPSSLGRGGRGMRGGHWEPDEQQDDDDALSRLSQYGNDNEAPGSPAARRQPHPPQGEPPPGTPAAAAVTGRLASSHDPVGSGVGSGVSVASLTNPPERECSLGIES